MTKRECAVIMTYTGAWMLTGDDLQYFYEYIAELMGRPVFTHELAALADDLKEKAKPDFIRLCREAVQDESFHCIAVTLSDMQRQLDDLNMSHNKLCDHIAKSKVGAERHGRWNYRHEDDWCYCTACGTDAEGSDGECLETDYCPHCGARMDGGTENAKD